ncbi:MAG: hypothetical protein V4633_01180 [Pseudomonadota bacterium]
MKSRLWMLVLVCVVVFHGSATAEQVQERQAIRAFLNAVLSRDEARLLAFEKGEEFFLTRDRQPVSS